MAIAVLIPVVAAGWLYGAAGGSIAGLLSLPTNILLSELIGYDWYQKIILTGGGIAGSISLVVLGFIVGRVSDLSRRLTKELSEKQRVESELQRHRTLLERMVEEKTAELSKAFENLVASNRELVVREKMLAASQELLKSVVDTTVDAVMTVNSRGEITEWNKAAEEMFGYTAAEVMGRSALMTIPVRFRDAVGDTLAEMLKRGRSAFLKQRVEGIGLRKDGSEFPAEVSQSVWRYGNEVYATGIVRDITERKKAEVALLEREERLRSIVDTAVDAIISTDSSGRIVSWNRAAQLIYGYAADEILGRPVSVLIPARLYPRDNEGLRDAVDRAKTSIVYNRIEGTGLRKGGTEFPSEVSQSIWSSGGEVFATGIVRDITDRKRGEAALQEREERLRAIVDSAVDAIISADSAGTIVFWNKAAEKIYGYTAQEVLGSNVSRLLPERFQQKERASMYEVFDHQGVQTSTESISIRKDGSEFPVEVTRALWSSGGKTYATAIVRDITERKAADRDRMLLSSAIDQAEENIMIMDGRGIILYANSAVVRQMERPLSRIIGANAFSPPDSHYDKNFFASVYGQLASGRSWKGVLNYKVSEGKTTLVEQSLYPVLDADGRVENILSVSRDVSRERSLEEQLRQSQKMEAIGTLAGGIAHDFNNILAAILGYTELASLDVPPGSPAAEKLQHVIFSCDRARSLVKQILTFSRKSAHELRPLTLSSMVKEAIKLLRASLPATIEIRQDIACQDAVIIADPTQIHQLIINLCTNAGHAMEEAGGVLDIGLAPCEVPSAGMDGCYDVNPGPYVRLTIRDTGPGIAPDIREKIFDPFFTTKGVGKGTGMGLSVVHGIVKTCGGCITVESEPGKGTAFHVMLPRSAEMPKASPRGKETVIPRGDETILFVDDEDAVAQVGYTMLSSLGYQVVSAGGSAEALDLFTAGPEKFACVITDMTMPHMTGAELARRLLEIRPGTPVILCTGYSEKISEEQALLLGARAFLMKPLTLQELAVAVRRVLDGT